MISVIIATCGRPERLARCLDAVDLALRTWGGDGEVIVVDNHPEYGAEALLERRRTTDDGRQRAEDGGQRTEDGEGRAEEVATDCSLRASGDSPQSVVCRLSSVVCPRTRHIRSTPFNKAKALNVGIAAAQGEWLAFTDDDTLPDAGWLREGLACAARTGWRVFGGHIVPGPAPAGLPRWLRPGRSGRIPGIGVFVGYEPLPATGLVPVNGTAPFGANLFVHRDVFREHGGYDEALWAACERMWPLGCEDSEFGHRLKLRNEPIGYCREALVVHPVNADRASLCLHLWRAYCDGWRQPLIFAEERRTWFEPFRLRLLFRRLIGALGDGCCGDAGGAADHLVEAARMAGGIFRRPTACQRRCAAAAGRASINASSDASERPA